MNAWLTLDFVAKRYGLLPSQLLKSGSSIDAKISILAVQYERFLQEKAQGEHTHKPVKEDDMLKMLEQARRKHNAKAQANAQDQQDS